MYFITCLICLTTYLLNDHIRLLNKKISSLNDSLLHIPSNASEKLKILNEIEELTLYRYRAIITEDLD